MSTRYKVLIAAAALFWIAALAQPAFAQYPYPFTSAQAGGLVADDGSVVFLCRFVGSDSASGTITVETDGNLTFKQGASGSEAADTTLECPVSGSLGGIVDVSDAACDTFDEVADIINASSDWVCAGPIEALAADSSNDSLLAQAEAAATDPAGLAIYIDNSVSLKLGNALTYRPGGWQDYVNGGARGTDLKDNPHDGKRAGLLHAYTIADYGSGTSTLTCFSVKQAYGASDALTETTTTIFTQASGADDTAKSFDSDILGDLGILGSPGEKVLCQVINSAAMTDVSNILLNGLEFNVVQ